MSNISKIQVGDTTYDIKDAEAERIVIKNSSGAIASFDDGIEVPAANVKVKIEPVQEGEGDPSPDNVRPISGWNGMKITRAGKNLFNISNLVNGHITEEGEFISINSARTTDFIPVIDGKITASAIRLGTTTQNLLRLSLYDSEKKFVRRVLSNGSDTGVRTRCSINDNNISYIRLSIFTQTEDINTCQIEYGVNQTEFEEFSNSYSITFPSETGTVYGGELDVTTGVLTVTHTLWSTNNRASGDPTSIIIRNDITEFWLYAGSTNRTYFDGIKCDSLINNPIGEAISNTFLVQSNYISSIKFYLPSSLVGTTRESINTYLNAHPMNFWVQLVTPITYQLTPTEVTTLLGQNNIWADTGDTSVNYWKNKFLADSIHSNFSMIKDTIGTKKYGVKGIGQAQSELTRTYDSVNMVAAVGSPTQKVRNDFDYAAPFMRRKCVGYWEKNPQHDKRAMFHVMAYEGDDNYTEDGTMGDYVAVECPRCYYKRDGDELIISAYKHQGFRAFDIFCHDHNQNDTMEFYYMPAYPLALKDGHAVSLPGLRNEQGDWASLYNSAKTYNNEEVAVLAQLMPAAVNFYEWALMTVEFATQNMQNIMYGVAGCYWADNKTGQFTSLEGTITFECAENPTTIIAGDYVRIGTYSGGSDNRTLPSHKVLTATSSNSKRILTLEPTGWSTISYTTETNYYISGSYVPTGLTKDILTPSGVEDHTATNTHNAIRYRYHENPYGNQYHTSADLFDVATIIPDATTTSVNVKYGASLDWYYLPDATSITTAVNPANNTTSLSTDERFVKLGVSTPSEKYASGYIKSVQYDIAYPDIWAPETTEGGSATTYFSDQASLVSSNLCRSCRFGGSWFFGTTAGPMILYAHYAPSSAIAYSGGDLYFPQ